MKSSSVFIALHIIFNYTTLEHDPVGIGIEAS